jgi:hypothetical protein
VVTRRSIVARVIAIRTRIFVPHDVACSVPTARPAGRAVLFSRRLR